MDSQQSQWHFQVDLLKQWGLAGHRMACLIILRQQVSTSDVPKVQAKDS